MYSRKKENRVILSFQKRLDSILVIFYFIQCHIKWLISEMQSNKAVRRWQAS